MSSTAMPANTYQPKGMLIDGKWVGSASGAHFAVENPAKRKPITDVPRAAEADVNAAVDAAEKALPAWKKIVPRERGKLLLKIAEAIQARVEELARTIALDHFRAEERRRRREGAYAADRPEHVEDGLFGGLSPALERALATLSAGEREVIALRVLLDLDIETAAQVLGISPTACTTRLSRALKKLEERMGEDVAA